MLCHRLQETALINTSGSPAHNPSAMRKTHNHRYCHRERNRLQVCMNFSWLFSRHSKPINVWNFLTFSDIDHSMFVLNVDLWNEDGSKEVNLVRSSTGSPSISSTTPYSYTTLNGGDPGLVPYTQHVLPSHRDPSYSSTHSVGYSQDYQLQASYNQGRKTHAVSSR